MIKLFLSLFIPGVLLIILGKLDLDPNSIALITFGGGLVISAFFLIWLYHGLPFPFINIACKLNIHHWLGTGNIGSSQVFWYGHRDAQHKKVFKYVEGKEVCCKKCGAYATELLHKRENWEYVKRAVGEQRTREICFPYMYNNQND